MNGKGALAILALAFAIAGCESCGSSSKKSDIAASDGGAAILVETPVPAPESLVAEATLTTPDATWKKIQSGMGPTAAILPSTFAGLLCAVAGLDPAIAHEIDAAAPAYGAIADAGDPRTSRDAGAGTGASASAGAAWAIALKLADAKRTQSLLVDGETAPFVAKDNAAGVRVLGPKPGGLPLQLTAGIVRSGWLVFASSEAELASLAPYAYRTLPGKPRPSSALEIASSHDALAGPLRARLAARWNDAKTWLVAMDAEQRGRHAGRDADFADAPALVACVDSFVQRRIALLGDLESMRIAIDAGDDELHAVVTMKAGASGGPAAQKLASMHPGDATPLLDAPLDAVVAWLVRDDAGERADDAREIAECFKRALGKRLDDADAKLLVDVADRWSKGRGDWLTTAVMWGASRGIVTRAPAADAESASRSLKDLAHLFARPAFDAPLRKYLHVTGVTSAEANVPGVGKSTLVTFAREEPRPPKDAVAHADKLRAPPPPPLGMAWSTTSGVLRFALAESAPELLAGAAKPKATFADEPTIARALRAAESNVTFVVVAKPFKVAPPPVADAGAASPPFTFAWGRRANDGFARIEIGYPLLQEIVRRAAGL